MKPEIDWERIEERWKFLKTIVTEVDGAIQARNPAQTGASLEGLGKRASRLAMDILVKQVDIINWERSERP